MPLRIPCFLVSFLPVTAATDIYTLSLHDALPISPLGGGVGLAPHGEAGHHRHQRPRQGAGERRRAAAARDRSEEHTSELQSLRHLVCRLLLEKKKDRQARTGERLARETAVDRPRT